MAVAERVVEAYRSLVATTAVEEGEVLLRETPIVCAQVLPLHVVFQQSGCPMFSYRAV
jgi:hypothetical protein